MTRAPAGAVRGAPPGNDASGPAGLGCGAALAGLLALTALAAVLRLIHPGSAPPGLNQDEAVNAWNAWCLLRTGADMTGAPWPVFYSHAIGDNRTTLYFYALLPFQALGGLSVWTARLPNALAGIASVPLAYYAGARLWGRLAGLGAAAVIAASAWPLLLGRWGIEGGLCPLLGLLPVALLIAARLVPPEGDARPPRAGLALLAGLAAGIACYGYWPMRLWVPALFAALAVGFAPEWRRVLRDPGGRRALLACAIGLALTAGPLAWRHASDPAIARRAEMTRLWDESTPMPERALRVAARWAEHFGPGFLFVHGDRFEIVRPPGQGEFSWTVLPLLLAGAAAVLARLRRSRAARLTAALVLIYPAGDLIARYAGPHAMRSAPGLGALALLAGAGLEASAAWLARRGRVALLAGALLLAVSAAAFDARFLARYFGSWSAQPEVYHGYQTDLVEAMRWLKPRLADYDAVFVTTQGMNEPFSVALVVLGWDPARWRAEPRDVRVRDGWDVVVRNGKLHYLYGTLSKPYADALQANGRPDRALFVVRPHELGLEHPVHVIRGPLGEALWLVEAEL